MAARIVGVLNVTPDSFSDGGRFSSVEDAVAAGLAMVAQGADWVDVGGESTRPGAVPVSEAEEIARVAPVIRELSARLEGRARVSIDTYKAATARAALVEGATAVNDVSGGLLDPEILRVAAAAQAAMVVGHLRGKPADMQAHVHFDNVVDEVSDELGGRVAAARAAGCGEVWADPGIGFGKHLPHNLRLLKNLARVRAHLGVPIMVGISRKRFIGELLTWEPWEGSQTLPRWSAAGEAGGLPTRLLTWEPWEGSQTLPRWSAAGDEGAREARGAGRVVVGPEAPAGGAGGLPTRLVTWEPWEGSLRPSAPTCHPHPARFARPRQTLPRWSAAGDEGAREARGAGRVVVGPEAPAVGAGGLPTRAVRPATERVFGTAAAVAVAIMNGADAVRVHDVLAMCDVVRVAEAIAQAEQVD
jgi:dihydropteroate synthase